MNVTLRITGKFDERVQELQKALNVLGYPEPRFGADGYLGRLTLDLVDQLVEDRRLIGIDDPTDGDVVPQAVVDAIMSLAEEERQAIESGRPDLFEMFDHVEDGRHIADPARRKRHNPIERIDTIVLHQMAVSSASTYRAEAVRVPDALAHLGSISGPVDVPQHTGNVRRWKRLAIHWAVTCGIDSRAWLLHDLDYRLPHAHGFNRRSVGIEVEGYFAGEHDLRTGKHAHFWKPKSRPGRKPMIPSEAQIEATRQAVKFTVEKIGQMGGQIRWIAPHRAAYGMKSSDPGQMLWAAVAIPMMEDLGLGMGPVLNHRKYPGKPVPESWDPRRCKGVPY